MANKALIALGAVGAGLAAYFLLSPSEASASEAAAPPKTGPKPAPAPGSPPKSGIKAECLPAFNRWSALAQQAVDACAKAANLTDEWWVWEEYRLNGEYSYDPAYHEQIRRDWEVASRNCDEINGASLAAMAEYERCAG